MNWSRAGTITLFGNRFFDIFTNPDRLSAFPHDSILTKLLLALQSVSNGLL